MGHVFDFNDALTYQSADVRVAMALENRLMLDLLKPMSGHSVLEIGCGAGGCLGALLDAGLLVTGLDASPYMLDLAWQRIGNRVDFHRGCAEEMPFEDNSFNYAVFMSSLEFCDDPMRAIEEACRVTKDRVFIGIVNRYAFKGLRLRLQGFFTESLYRHTRFFSVWELKQMLRRHLGDVPMQWRTVCRFPSGSSRIIPHMEQFRLVQRFPFGAFAGLVASLVPRFKTRPMTLSCPAGHVGTTVFERFYPGPVTHGPVHPDSPAL
jgi:ubiquinone/menaquinone biosynthesis C-methylase UbiE